MLKEDSLKDTQNQREALSQEARAKTTEWKTHQMLRMLREDEAPTWRAASPRELRAA